MQKKFFPWMNDLWIVWNRTSINVMKYSKRGMNSTKLKNSSSSMKTFLFRYDNFFATTDSNHNNRPKTTTTAQPNSSLWKSLGHTKWIKIQNHILASEIEIIFSSRLDISRFKIYLEMKTKTKCSSHKS